MLNTSDERHSHKRYDAVGASCILCEISLLSVSCEILGNICINIKPCSVLTQTACPASEAAVKGGYSTRHQTPDRLDSPGSPNPRSTSAIVAVA